MHGFRMPAHAAVSPSVSNLPARSNVVIRNAYVMTMEPGRTYRMATCMATMD